MSIECPLCPRSGCSEAMVHEMEQRVGRMLDAAKSAGVDLCELEKCRRTVQRDLRRVGRLRARRRRELERSIELGVETLALGFKKMVAALAEDHRR